MGGEQQHKAAEAPLATTPVLLSAARHIAKKCSAQGKEFMECKRALGDPEKCVEQGHRIITCVSSLLKELHSTCGSKMDSFSNCMDYYSRDFEMCRKEQLEFEDACPL